MRRTGMWLSVLAMVMIAGSVSATPSGFTTDGDWSDWFSYTGTTSKNWDQATAAASRDAGVRFDNPPNGFSDGDGTTPGGGGQDYDIEQIFYFWEDFSGVANDGSGGILHIGMVTGFDPYGANGSGGPHFAGDMFIDLGNDGLGTYDIAVAVGQETNAANGGDTSPADGVGDRFGTTWVAGSGFVTTGVNVPGHAGVANPYRIDESSGAIEYGTGLASGLSSSVSWGIAGVDNTAADPTGLGQHNFLEIAVEVDGSLEEAINNGAGVGGLGLHWTMLCGNDHINVQDGVPLDPVPEPTTMVLLGMGVLGMTLRARRPVC